MNSNLRKRTAAVGRLTIQHPSLAPLCCSLADVGEEGCRATVSFNALPPETVSSWKALLQIGARVQVVLAAGTQPARECTAVLRGLIECLNFNELELIFEKPAASQRSPSRPEAPAAAAPVIATPAPLDLTRTDVREFLRGKRIGEVFVHMGFLPALQLNDALAAAKAANERLGRFLLRMNLITPEVLCRALAMQSGLPMVDLAALELAPETVAIFPSAILQKYAFVPFDEAAGFICIAAAEPLPARVLREIESISNKRVQQFLAAEDALLNCLSAVQLRRTERQYPRSGLALPVRYQFCDQGGAATEETVYFVRSVNVSEGGLAVEGQPNLLLSCPEVRRQDLFVRVLIRSGKDIEGVYRLRWVHKSERDHRNEWRWLIGMQLARMNTPDRQMLQALCARAR